MGRWSETTGGGAVGEASDVVLGYFKCLSAGDVDGALVMVAEDGDFRTPMGAMTGKGTIRAYLGAFESAFPRATYEIDRLVESDGTVAAEGSYRATHQGPMLLPDGTSLPATGRTVMAPFVTMFEVKNGLITSHRPYWDLAGFMAQLTG
jgi:steroid delta-isomerase-like uncharacterized protein